MHNFFKGLLITALVLMLAGCGSGKSGGGNSGDPANPNALVRALQLLVSSPQLPSAQEQSVETTSVTLTAVAKSEDNNLLEGVDVDFAADGGNIQVIRGTTDMSGTAEALLTTTGNATNRTITVNASASGVATDSNLVSVIGTSIDVAGVSATVLGETVTLTASLTDSEGVGIANVLLDVSSDNDNPLMLASNVTDNNGTLEIQVLGEIGGPDNIRVEGLGASAVHPLLVNTASFAFTNLAGREIPLNSDAQIRLEWRDEGRDPPEQVGREVTFSTTRGRFVESDARGLFVEGGTSSVTLMTVPGISSSGGGRQAMAVGVATATLRADNAGPAVVSASSTDGNVISTQIDQEFVATVPTSIVAQANPSQVGSGGEQSTITVTVRDVKNNPVKNTTVSFDLNDVTGGTISTGIDVTDSLGNAQTLYTSSAASSGADAVIVTAAVADNPLVQTTVELTVARDELFIQLGTGNDVILVDETRYALPYSALVTDVESNGVEGATVDVEAIPSFYYKGYYVKDGPTWILIYTSPPCPNEDINRNGILDPGEDTAGLGNGNGRLEPGNVISVDSPQTTNADGFATFQMPYAKQFANWVEVRLEARGAVAGSEALSDEFFTLPVAGADVMNEFAPPGAISPFGTSTDCTCSVEDELPPIRPGCERGETTLGGEVVLAVQPQSVTTDSQVLLSLTRDTEAFADVPVTGIVTGKTSVIGSGTDLSCVTDASGFCLLNVDVRPSSSGQDSATIVYSAAGQVAMLSVQPPAPTPVEPPVPQVVSLQVSPSSLSGNGRILLTVTLDEEPTNGVTINGVVSGSTNVIDMTASDLSCVTGAATTDATPGRGQCLNDIVLQPGAPSGESALVTWAASGKTVELSVSVP